LVKSRSVVEEEREEPKRGFIYPAPGRKASIAR
jgi:hypothetical protein